MDSLFIEGKKTFPTIDFKADGSQLRIVGRSIPEHPVKFYQPVEAWLVSYLANNPKSVELLIHLDYLNTHSTECILFILKKLNAHNTLNSGSVKVVWNYDEYDEDMQVLGEDLKNLVNLPFEINEVSEG